MINADSEPFISVYLRNQRPISDGDTTLLRGTSK